MGGIALASPTEVHGDFRKVRGSWERTMAILRNARTVRLRTQINTTVTTHNVDMLPDMVTFVKEVVAVQWRVFSIVPMGAARS